MNKDALEQVSSPPSVVLKQLFTELHVQGKSFTEDIVESAAKKVLLPTQEVEFWLDHLATVSENRRRGATKAAETRRRKRQVSSNTTDRDFCGTCEIEYQQEMANIEFWINCDFCQKWYCCLCEFLTSPPTTEEYKCLKCQCH